jgi:hypothetical protein
MSEVNVPVASYQVREDAEAIVQVLARAGVDSGIIASPAIFHVVVRAGDEERADEALNRHYGVADAEEKPEIEEPLPVVRVCPECGSEDVGQSSTLRHFVALSLLIYGAGVAVDQAGLAAMLIACLAVAMFIGNRWHCADCGAKWSGTE